MPTEAGDTPLNYGPDGRLATFLQATRAIIQGLHGGKELEALPERCSIKVPGCPEWVPHLDRSREGSFQIVIALADSAFMVWPRSHLVAIGRDTTGFHGLCKDELSQLHGQGSQKTVIPAVAGDVLVMVGGRCVHSSPAVIDGDHPRIATYASWKVSVP